MLNTCFRTIILAIYTVIEIGFVNVSKKEQFSDYIRVHLHSYFQIF
jgi:hypothetical protein